MTCMTSSYYGKLLKKKESTLFQFVYITKLDFIDFQIYKGYVDDPRNTDNAWMETVANNFHDETGNFLGGVELKVNSEAPYCMELYQS